MAGVIQDSVGKLATNSLTALAKYKFILIGVLIIATLIGTIYVVNKLKKNKDQWTHSFKVRRQYADGSVSKEIETIKAARFPKEPDTFLLKNPIVGKYLIAQPGPYTGKNEFSIILDSDNRIWNIGKEVFDKDTGSLHVSMVHAGIDIAMNDLSEKWQKAHAVKNKITAMEIIASALKVLMILAVIIISIVAIQQWGDSQKAKAQADAALAVAMNHLTDQIPVMNGIVNTQQLQITKMLEAQYGTNNLASVLAKYGLNYTNGTIS